MKIFFYSSAFSPSVGGIETLVEVLCRQFSALGHEVEVATETPGDETHSYPFGVTRRGSLRQLRRLLTWCDIHVQANVSLKAAWMVASAPRKSIYQHNNVYQRDDGSKGSLDLLKIALAHAFPGIANSSYTSTKTGAENVILNAYDDATFRQRQTPEEKDRDLVFLGRLVSQKGGDTLIDALGLLSQQGCRPNLTIIGDGAERPALEQGAARLQVGGQIRFLGGLTGLSLATEIAKHRVIVVPSRYEEPFGIVALEGLASGCVPIVSERGGMLEAIGGHGFTFANGDSAALAEQLRHVLSDYKNARQRLNGVESHLARCSARAVAAQYVAVFKRHLEERQ